MDNVMSNEAQHQELPTNSDTILRDETTSRFSGADWASKMQSKNIIIAGVGGVGSYCSFLISRLKPGYICIYDSDIVEEGNMSGQLYGRADIGNYKVYSMSQFIKDYSFFYNIMAFNGLYTGGSGVSDIMICGFDNMASRKIFYSKWKNHVNNLSKEAQKKALFIDARLAAEYFQVFCLKYGDEYHMKDYETNWLFSDSEAEATVCSYKQTSHCATMVASVMTNLLVNHVANECDPIIERDVPYLTTYDASTMYFKTKS